MVPFPTVLHLVEGLSDNLYNTIPAQPPPSVPSVTKTKAELKQQSKEPPQACKSSSGTELHEVPPPDDPLEEQSIWCEIMKLEGRKTNNKIADGFVNWCKTNMDSIVLEVKIYMYIYSHTILKQMK